MIRQKRKRKMGIILLMAMLFSMVPNIPLQAAGRAQDYGDSLVVVIDAGHGGENLGAKDYGPLEKDLTLVTAKAMYEELGKYDGVSVYMTRTDDVDLTLAQRAQYAKDVGADFLFSLHYNASESHKRFGSEVFVSALPPYNGYGYQFGSICLNNLSSMGLYNRGVKIREGSAGDYYGILRESSGLGIPSAIIEHCYLDEENDRTYADSTEEYERFGRMDATSVAQYFGLKSTILGVDYSNTDYVNVDASKVVPTTVDYGVGPESLEVQLWNNNPSTGDVSISVHGFDTHAAILYYEYSIDGGISYTPFYKWPGANALNNENDNDFVFSFHVPDDTSVAFILRAYNIFDEMTASNLLDLNTRVLATEYSQGKPITPVAPTASANDTTYVTAEWSPNNATYESAEDWNAGDTTVSIEENEPAGRHTSSRSGMALWLPVILLAAISLIIVLLFVLVIRLFLLEHHR